jgi:FlaA1/EpsC-like NDP-sugar epimerase
MRFDAWTWPHEASSAWAVVAVLGVYASALVLGGAYARTPRTLGLNEFLHLGTWICGAFAASVAAAYLAAPGDLLPRTVAVVHALIALVGTLGLRAVLRRIGEWLHPERGTPPPPAPSGSADLRDFVERPSVSIHTAALRDLLADRTVMVTGAGGSIGSELCEQLVGLQPERLVLVDVSEYNLFRVQQSLDRRRTHTDLVFQIADVRDADRMDAVFGRYTPDVVLHTAAYKHVPLMESHAGEAFRNNTLATATLVDAAEAHGVEQFVFVSTDKAVDPTSVLGATKRLAEWYVQAGSTATKRKIVRFGNVFGSQGSVVQTFEDHLRRGDPLPITHPDMERYFMTVHEACSLILQTLLLDSHPTYILRMGDPVRIEWLARQMIERYRPDVPVDRMIEYVGRRPGEKLSETLTHASERACSLDHPSILGIAPGRSPSLRDVRQRLEYVSALAQVHSSDDTRLRDALLSSHVSNQGDGVAHDVQRP